MIRKSSFMATVALAMLFTAPVTFDLPLIGSDIAHAKGGNGNGNSGGNGNGNSGGNGNGNSGGNGNSAASSGKKADDTVVASVEEPKNAHGLLASELKGLNAVHANPNALLHASPNSQVGRIAAYRDAALATSGAAAAVEAATTAAATAQQALTDATDALAAYDAAYTGRSTAEIDAEIAGLDTTAVDYDAQLAALNDERIGAQTYEDGRITLASAVDTATTGAADAAADLAEAEAAAAGAEQAEADALLAAANGRTLSDEAVAYIRAQLGL